MEGYNLLIWVLWVEACGSASTLKLNFGVNFCHFWLFFEIKADALPYSLSREAENLRDEHWYIGGCSHRVRSKSIEG